MHYLVVPVLFEAGNKISFQFGAQAGFLIAGKEKGTVASVEVNEKVNDVMTFMDVGLVGGIGYSLNSNINFGLRLNYGLTNIYNPEVDYNSNFKPPIVQNRVLHFYVAYSF